MIDKIGIKKKILCVSVMQNWGGGEEFLLKLKENIKEYEFIIASPNGNALDHFRNKRIKFFEIKSLKKIYRGSGWNFYSLIKIIFNIKISTFNLLKIVKTNNIDLILANGLYAALFALPSAILTRKKLLVVQHLIFNEKSVEKKVLNLIQRYVNNIICVSNAVRENVLVMLKNPDLNKIIVIPNGVNIPETKLQEIKKYDHIKIGMVGSIIRIKGIHLVLEALINILKENNISFHIYGITSTEIDSINYKSELNNIININGIADKVSFEGYSDSKDNIYNSLDIVINSSLIPEAFPFSVLECMAYKKIIIAVNAGGSKEIIQNGSTGFLVEPRNVTQLKESIEYCIKNIGGELLNQMRIKAFEQIKSDYSTEKFRTNYQNLFNSLLS